MIRRWALLLVGFAASGCTADTDAVVSVDPASGSALASERIVTLAPHLAELVYTAGAGERIVGVSAWSDYPPAVLEIEIVSDAFTVDLERLDRLAPTLILAWDSGTPRHVVDELRELQYRVEVIETRGLEDIATALERIGALTGDAETAAASADEFRRSIAELREAYSGLPSISVFYQVSGRPLYTVGGGHYIGEIVELCGGRNVFSDVGELAPPVTVEAVVSRDPEVALAGSSSGDAFADWDRWPDLNFNRYGNRFTLVPEEIGRATTRLMHAAEAVCETLQTGRANRAAAS